MRVLVVPAVLFALVAGGAGITPLGAQGAAPAADSSVARAAGAAGAGAGCTAPTHRTAAHELIVTVGAERMVKQSTDAMIDAQLRASPLMAQHFGDLLREFVDEQMQWSVLEPEFVRLYCELFTEPELREMTAFNRTPLGQKIITVTPELMRRAMTVGEQRVQANMPAFQKRIEERVAKLKAEGTLPE